MGTDRQEHAYRAERTYVVCRQDLAQLKPILALSHCYLKSPVRLDSPSEASAGNNAFPSHTWNLPQKHWTLFGRYPWFMMMGTCADVLQKAQQIISGQVK